MDRLAIHMKLMWKLMDPTQDKDSASQTTHWCLGDMGPEGMAWSAAGSYMGKRGKQEVRVQGQV